MLECRQSLIATLRVVVDLMPENQAALFQVDMANATFMDHKSPICLILLAF